MSVNTIVRFSYVLLSLALLGGCGGGSAVPSQAVNIGGLSNSPVMTPGANHYGEDLMLAMQPLNNDIGVYTRSGFTITPAGTISYGVDEPQGSMSTVNHFVYVTNTGHSNVLVYRIKKAKHIPKGPIDTLDDSNQYPVNVAATPSRNLVAVSNGSTTSGGAGSVSIYLNRQSEPSRVLTYGNPSDPLQGEGVAIDHQGNCFWSFNDPEAGSGSIVEFASCNGSGTVIVSGIPQAGGIVFDQSGDLFYVNQGKGSGEQGVYQCQKLSKCGGLAVGYKYFTQPTNMNFDYKEKALWVSDAAGYIDAIVLPKGKKGFSFYQNASYYGAPYGIAPEPGD